MSKLWIQVAECKYKENERWLKEQFISSIKNSAMTNKIIKELTTKTVKLPVTKSWRTIEFDAIKEVLKETERWEMQKNAQKVVKGNIRKMQMLWFYIQIETVLSI